MTSAIEISLRPPRATAVGRIADYLVQMFPPWLYIPSGVASFYSAYLALQAISSPGPLRATWRSAAGAATVILLTLLLRVYDELKDAESDRRLAREGDPRYRTRPIVTGHIQEADLIGLRRGVIAMLVVLNAPLGFPLPLVPFAVALGIFWLSSRWFFWPAIQHNLLLAFATHNPLTLVVAGYVVAVFAADFGAGALGPSALVIALAAWLPIAAWELSRKVRAPADETSYQTYSMLLGWRTAAWLPGIVTAGAASCFMWIARAARLEWPFSAVVIAAALVVLGACARFRLRPNSATAKLQPFVEAFVLVTTAGLPIALWLSRSFA